MDREESQSIVWLARDCETSIIGMLDDARSANTETTANISIMFDFDALILNSRIYQQAQRSHLRQAIRARNEKREDSSIQPHCDMDTITEAPIIMDEDDIDTTGGRGRDSDQTTGRQSPGTVEPLEHSPHDAIPARGMAPSSTPGAVESKPNAQPSPEPPSAGKSSRQGAAVRWSSWLKKSPRRKDSIVSPTSIRPPQKILILGTSESGKTTLLRTLQVSCGQEFSAADRRHAREIIWSNVVQCTRVVLEAMEAFSMSLGDPGNEYHVQTILVQPSLYDGDDFPQILDVAEAIKTLLEDDGFHNAYKLGREYKLDNSFRYYISHIDRIFSPHYMPTEDDILRTRVKTTGMAKTSFSYNNINYAVFDLAGARSERRKWASEFEYVSTIVFTIDAACYARLLFEDETFNRMQEQLNLFDSIVNNERFGKTDFLIVFTKLDLIEECLQEWPAEEYFPDYSRDMLLSPTESYMRYIEGRFAGLIQSDEVRNRTGVILTNLVDDAQEKGVQIWDILERFERSRGQ